MRKYAYEEENSDDELSVASDGSFEVLMTYLKSTIKKPRTLPLVDWEDVNSFDLRKMANEENQFNFLDLMMCGCCS